MVPNFEFQDKMRIVQELVPGRQITLAHIIANPDPTLYQKLPGWVAFVIGGELGIRTLGSFRNHQFSRLAP